MKTAIIVRGQARTWNYLKDYTIKHMSLVYPDSDWYVVIPESTTVSEESLTNDFKSVNLVSLQRPNTVEYPIPYTYGYTGSYKFNLYTVSYWRPAWYDYLANLAKREYELDNNIRYDNVLTIRPDVHYNFEKPETYKGYVHPYTITLDPMAVSNMNFSSAKTFNHWKCPDLVWRAGSTASDIMGMRLLDTFFTNHIPNNLVFIEEMSLAGYYQAKNLINGAETVGDFQGQVTCPYNGIAEEVLSTDQTILWQHKKNWHFLNKQSRIDLCNAHNIDINDYYLGVADYPFPD